MLARRNGGEVMIVSLPGHGTKATLLLPAAAQLPPTRINRLPNEEPMTTPASRVDGPTAS
jgi:hypothetical protein